MALVLLLFAAAVAEHFPDPITGIFIDATTVATLALGVWSFKAERHWLRTGVGFVAAILIVIVFDLILEVTDLHYVQICIMLVFFVLTAWLAARQVLFTGSIDANKVIGAVCIFLLLGIIWAMLYLLVAGAAPASFNGLDAAKWYDNFPHLAYFSFVSLTTLGYGDITPALPVARLLGGYRRAVVRCDSGSQPCRGAHLGPAIFALTSRSSICLSLMGFLLSRRTQGNSSAVHIEVTQRWNSTYPSSSANLSFYFCVCCVPASEEIVWRILPSGPNAKIFFALGSATHTVLSGPTATREGARKPSWRANT